MKSDSEVRRIALDKARDAIIHKYGVVSPHTQEAQKLYDSVYESTMNELRQFNS